MTADPGGRGTPTGDLVGRLAAALERIGEASRVLLRAAASREHLSTTQAQVLLRLYATTGDPGQHGVVALARWLDVSTPTVSDALATLERKRLVAREAEGTDGRRVQVVTTRSGSAAARRLSTWDAPLREALVAASEASGTDDTALAGMLDHALRTIATLQRSGVVSVARTCRGCRFFDPEGRDGATYWCNLLESPLEPATLRVDCPEYQAS